MDDQQQFVMTQEEQQYSELYQEQIYHDLKIRCQSTAIFTKDKLNHTPFKFEHTLSNQTESSFQNGIHQENVEHLRVASIMFLDDCLVEKYDREQGFRNMLMFDEVPFYLDRASQMEHLTEENQLLLPSEQDEWLAFLKENPDITNMLKLIVPTFGITVGKQMVYIFFRLLKLKLQDYKEMIALKQSAIPKFNCFLGYQNETFDCPTSCPIYQQLNAQEIIQFAGANLQEFNNTIYFAKEMKFMTLKKSKLDTKGNILSKMLPLVKQCSRILFLTIAGISEPQIMANDIFSVSLSRENSFNYLQLLTERQLMTSQRSLSRPSLPYEQQQNIDSLSKKQKRL